MNILLIGGAGFIGSNLIKTLSKETNSIYVLEPEGANTDRLKNSNINLLKGSLSDFNYVRGIIEKNEIEIVVHLVSTLIPGSSYEDYKEEYKRMIFPSIELMELCAERSVKFVYFSSGVISIVRLSPSIISDSPSGSTEPFSSAVAVII